MPGVKSAVAVIGIAGVLGIAWLGEHSGSAATAPSSSTSTVAPVPTTPSSTTSVIVPTSVAPTGTAAASTTGSTAPTTATGGPPTAALDQALAKGQAIAFLQAYARPPAGPALYGWWDTVSTFVAPQAMATMHKVDPHTVPFTKVTGPAVSLPTPAKSHDQLIGVPTDHGQWTVRLTPTGDQRWLVLSAAATKSAPKPSTKPTPSTKR